MICGLLRRDHWRRPSGSATGSPSSTRARSRPGAPGVVDVLPQLGVLLGVAVVVFAPATWRLRRAVTG
jgi:hypothetical protein